MERIFISYKRANKDQVFSLVEKIEKELGVKCWIDLDGIETSTQFASKICNAIDKADVVLFMYSSVHLSIDFEEDWTIKELNYARATKKKVALVKLDDSPLTNIFLLEYGSKNNIDSNDPQQFAVLLNDLRLWLNLPHKNLLSKVNTNDVNLKVLSNLDCRVLVDCEERCIATADHMIKIPLAVGEYYVEYISTQNSLDAISRELSLFHDTIEKVDLLSLKLEREKAQEIETADLVPCISNNKFGFADTRTHNVAIPCKYDFAFSFSDGLAQVKLNGKWGYINKSGTEITPIKYDDTCYFHDGLAAVGLDEKYGFIDKSGIEVIPLKYDCIISPRYRHCTFEDGVVRVLLDGKRGCINKLGNEVIPIKYDDVNSFHEGLARVNLNGEYGFVNKSGAEVIPIKYDYVDSFEDGLARIELNGKCGFIDRLGKEIIPLKYDDYKFNVEDYCTFTEGLAGVKQKGKWGFIDKLGVEVIPIKYDDVSIFEKGLARVKLNGKSGFIDKSGAGVIPIKYESVESFEDGLARVKLNGKWGWVDIFGNEKWD